MHKKSNYRLMIIFVITFLINTKMAFADMCDSMPETIGIINELLGIVKIAIPILLITLGTVDFVKAMVAKDEQGMKKAQSTFVTRLIIGVAIFFVPMIMRFLLDIIGYGDSCFYDVFNF